MHKWFPSPLGELHFQIGARAWQIKKPQRSFRPLSGNYISKLQSPLSNRVTASVSVPSRGTTFPNRICAMCLIICYRFPSPLGELHFQIVMCLDIEAGEPFPSPLGELHFQMKTAREYMALLEKFPSPLGELHFQIKQNEYNRKNYDGFRPLSGNYISK